ncbi:YaaR family protein [Pseudalkalibacillus sp. SCS-8]|uniref:YaaR family protein n=1 Tax=Pseudalkalibacillus nanhaiensis TaxID=3115291 RepID=UPI0032DA7172
MEIRADLRSTVEHRLQEGKNLPVNSGKFQSVVQAQQEKLQNEHLSSLLGKIESQGKRLVRSRTLSDLREYKRLVKRFVKESVEHGMSLKKSRSWGGQGNLDTMRLIERIDEELLMLTDELVAREGESIDILSRIGEIKGLLVNLYT